MDHPRLPKLPSAKTEEAALGARSKIKGLSADVDESTRSMGRMAKARPIGIKMSKGKKGKGY